MRLCVIVAAVIIVGACGDSRPASPPDATTPARPTTVAEPSPSTEPEPPPTITTAPAPATSTPPPGSAASTPSPPPTFPPLLVMLPDRVEVITGEGRRALWEGPAATAYPDGEGGALIGVDDGAGFWWDTDLGRYVLAPPEATGILRVHADGEQETFMPSTYQGLNRLAGVTEIDGRATAVLLRTVVGPPCCDGDPEAPQREFASIRTLVVLVDIATGAETAHGVVVGYETDFTVASFGGDVVAMSVHEYAGGMGPLWWTRRGSLAEVDGATVASGAVPWLAEDCLEGGCATAGPVAPCEEEGTCWNVMRVPSVAPDGSAVAYVEALEGPGASGDPVVVVVVDLPSAEERWRLRLDLGDPGGSVWAAAVGFDGETVLVSFSAPAESVVLAGESGVLATMPIDGVAVRWHDGR